MRNTHHFVAAVIASFITLAATQRVPAQAPAQPHQPNPFPHDANEPMAEAFSLAKSAEYLDVTARFWMNNSCGSCHANYAYLMARPLVQEAPDSAVQEMRRFLETRLETFRNAMNRPDHRPKIFFQSEIVGIAVALAFDDAHTRGNLRPTTRHALDHMWQLQKTTGRTEGTWSCGCGEFPLVELDPYYCATLAALAVGVAPDRYAQSAEAKDGITRLRRYLGKSASPMLHHQAMHLWASVHLDGLMTAEEQRAATGALLAKQRPDGGWSLPPLCGASGDPNTYVSDGYATGLVLYVLRQAGVPRDRRELVRGARWLQSNQRASGGWYTYSHHAGQRPESGHGTRELGLLNAGTAFAVMALQACQQTERTRPAAPSSPARRVQGLALRGQWMD